MTEETKSLAAPVIPSAGNEVMLYKVPAEKFAVLSKVVACNQNTTEATVKVRVAIADAGSTLAQFVEWNTRIPVGFGGVSLETLKGYPLQATDAVYVSSNLGNVSFNISGSEVTPTP